MISTMEAIRNLATSYVETAIEMHGMTEVERLASCELAAIELATPHTFYAWADDLRRAIQGAARQRFQTAPA